MDEEDMADFGIAPKQVRATAAFDNREAKRGRAAAQEGGRALQHLDNLLQPSREDIGHRCARSIVEHEEGALDRVCLACPVRAGFAPLFFSTSAPVCLTSVSALPFPCPPPAPAFPPFRRLLKAMGWREGQGVGERIRPARLPDAEDHSGDNDQRSAMDFAARLGVTLAPRDVAAVEQTAKDNFHGIGYTGLSAKDFNLDAGAARRPMGGMGVGVFEEEDDDIYADDDRKNYDR